MTVAKPTVPEDDSMIRMSASLLVISDGRRGLAADFGATVLDEFDTNAHK